MPYEQQQDVACSIGDGKLYQILFIILSFVLMNMFTIVKINFLTGAKCPTLSCRELLNYSVKNSTNTYRRCVFIQDNYQCIQRVRQMKTKPVSGICKSLLYGHRVQICEPLVSHSLCPVLVYIHCVSKKCTNLETV